MSHKNDPRQELVDCIRMLEKADIIDHNGHVSIRYGDNLLINNGSAVKGLMTQDDLVEIDMDGNVVSGKGKPPLEFHIHTEIYRARPDVQAVAHTHPKWSTFLTMVGKPYKHVYAQGVLLGDMPVMNTPMSVNTKPMGERLAQTLGKRPAVLLKSHGVTIVGTNMIECFALAAYVEENCYRQYMAEQLGEPYEFSEEEKKACFEKLWSTSLFQKTWDHYRSKVTG